MERAMLHGTKLNPFHSSQLLSHALSPSVEGAGAPASSGSTEKHGNEVQGVGAQTKSRRLQNSRGRSRGASVDARIVSTIAEPLPPPPQSVDTSTSVPRPSLVYFPSAEVYNEAMSVASCFPQPRPEVQESGPHILVGPSYPCTILSPVYPSTQSYWPGHTTRVVDSSMYPPLSSSIPPHPMAVPLLQPLPLPMHHPQLSLVPQHVPVPQIQLQFHPSTLSIAQYQLSRLLFPS
jgi:hypothetical protein